jgi:hypothetical protein
MRIFVRLGHGRSFNGAAGFVERLFDYLKPRVDAVGSTELRARFSDENKEVLQAHFWDLSDLGTDDYRLLLRLVVEMRPHLASAMAPWEDRFKHIYESEYEKFISNLASVN